jgi:FAD:protein FMN transferase
VHRSIKTDTIMMQAFKYLIMICAFSLLLAACQAEKETMPISFVGEAQGTYYLVTYFDAKSRNFQPQVDSLLQAFDQSVSLWEPESILSRINRGDSLVDLDQVFLYNFELSKEVAEATNGALDFTVAPLVRAYGFSPGGRSEITTMLIDSLKSLVDYRKVRLIDGRVVKEDPRISFDFNAVAQGYSVDLIAHLLISRGITSFIVDVGGEIYAHNKKPDGTNWLVGIETPADEKTDDRHVSSVVRVENKAIATSGNYRKYYEKDGVRYSHTIDPKTGYPVEHSLLSVTVMAENAALADAYATAFMVMGHEQAISFVEEYSGLEAHFIWSGQAGELTFYSTQGLINLIDN